MQPPRDGSGPPIVWVADDPEQYHFQCRGVTYTVYNYMRERHGLTLKFPKMPIVSTKYGYFPIEFLFQAMGLMKGANSDDQKNVVLAYHDATGGEKKIPSIQDAVSKLNRTVELQFGLDVGEQPLTLRATKLAEPSLLFGNDTTQDVHNGSWNLRGVKFHMYVLGRSCVGFMYHSASATNSIYLRDCVSQGC